MAHAFRDNDSLPFAGVRVVEFSHMVMGPTCGMILADLGADVVKVEPSPDGDNTRRLRGAGAGYFPTFNRNKRSLSLDLKSPEGQKAAGRLLDRADVVIENFRPGALDKLGLGYETLRERNPRLVYCSMKGFLSGPYEHRVALDEVVQMMGGLAYMTGPSGRPLRAGTSVNDIMGGMFAVIAVMAALRERDQTGKGQLVRSGLFENNVFLVAQHMMQEVVTGQEPAPMPERLASWAVYDLFGTADGQQVFVGIVSDTQWRVFCEHHGFTDLLSDPDLQSNRDRVIHRDRFMPRLRAFFAAMPRDAVLASCEAMKLPYAPIQRPRDLFDDPHVNQPGGTVAITVPDAGRASVPSLPVDFDGKRLGLRHDVPLCGQHNAEVLRELGYGPEEIEGLTAKVVA